MADSQSTSSIPFGLCRCGCGKNTTLYRRARANHPLGTPYDFVRGHNCKGMRSIRKPVTKGYRCTTTDAGPERLHIVRAELALGKPLPKGAEVHHADLSISDTAPLVICQNRAYHGLLHMRTRIVRAGGNPNTQRICADCKCVCDLSEFATNRARRSGIGNQCRPCRNIRSRERHRRNKSK